MIGEIILGLIAVAAVSSQLQKNKKQKKSNSPRNKTHTEITEFHWPPTGDFDFEVVGEFHYQQAIKSLAGEHDEKKGALVKCIASLIPEDHNPYDDKAVRIEINGMTVGHLSKFDARRFRKRLGSKKLTGATTTCDAIIRGGFTRKNGETTSYGVFLAIKPFN